MLTVRGLLIHLGVQNVGRYFVRKPRRHLELLYAKRAKKKARRRIMLRQRNSKIHEQKTTAAPRWLKRQRELVGSTYWRGDRRVLEDFYTRGCQ